MCVNKYAKEKNIEETLKFIEWCVTAEEPTRTIKEFMKLDIPYKKAKPSENVFIEQEYQSEIDVKQPVKWHFEEMSSEDWRNDIAIELVEYVKNPTDENWSKFKSAFVDGWEK